MKKLLFMFLFFSFIVGCSGESPIDYIYAYEIVDIYTDFVECTAESKIDLRNRGLIFAADGFDFELISEPRFDWIHDAAGWGSPGLFSAGIDSSIYEIDRRGKLLRRIHPSPPLPHPSPFHTRDNLIARYAIYGYSRAQCSISLLWGISDEEHNWVVRPLFLQLQNLYGGNLMVQNQQSYWGIIDLRGNEILPAIYDEMERVWNLDRGVSTRNTGVWTELFMVRQGNVFSLYDSDLNLIMSSPYRPIRAYENKFIRVSKNSLYGVIDIEGNIIIPLVQSSVRHIGDGYFLLTKNNQRRLYRIEDGEMIPLPYPYSYYNVLHIYGSFYLLQTEYNQYVYDTAAREKVRLDLDYRIYNFCHGDVLSTYGFVEPHNFINIYARHENWRFTKGLIDRSGNIIAPPIFSWIIPSHTNDVFFVYLYNDTESYYQAGMINAFGEFIVPFGVYDWIYRSASPCGDEVVLVRVGGSDSSASMWNFLNEDCDNTRWGIIDFEGREVIPPTYRSVSRRHWQIANFTHENFLLVDGLINVQCAETSLWGFIDTMGYEVIPPAFIYSLRFGFLGNAVGYAIVKCAEAMAWGIIDIAGRVVIPFEFDWIDHFAGDFALANTGGINNESAYFGAAGEFGPRYDWHNWILGGIWHLIDRDANIIASFDYTYIALIGDRFLTFSESSQYYDGDWQAWHNSLGQRGIITF